MPTIELRLQPELTTEQLEAVRLADEMGYYAPRSGVTHADLAAEMGCASSTAGVHLRAGVRQILAAYVQAVEEREAEVLIP